MRRTLLLLPLVVLAACGDGEPAAEAPETTTTSTTVVAGDTATAGDGLVEVELTVPATAPAGERLWATVTVRNVGDRPVYWQAGGNSPPVQASLTVPGEATLEGPHPPWDGEPAHLGDDLLPTGTIAFREEGTVGLDQVARESDSRMVPLTPGDERTERVAADIRLRPGARTGLLATARFVGYDEPEHYGGEGSVGPRKDVVASRPVEVTGLPTGHEPALAAFAADPALAAFVAGTDVAGVEQGWYTTLVWWRGAWELVVTPRYSDDERGQSRYRLRFDPDEGRVVDARRIWWDQSPEDDPGGTHFPQAPPDDVDPR